MSIGFVILSWHMFRENALPFLGNHTVKMLIVFGWSWVRIAIFNLCIGSVDSITCLLHHFSLNLLILLDLLVSLVVDIILIVRVAFFLIRVKLVDYVHKHILKRTVGNSDIWEAEFFFYKVHSLKQSWNLESWWHFKDQVTIKVLEQVSAGELLLHELNNLSANLI